MGNNDIKVRDLADTSSITTDNQMMVLTDDANNTVKNIKVEDLITNIISGDNNNLIAAGTDKKLYAADPTNKIGNLANLTTTNKSNLVAAINELDSDIGSEDTKIGDLANLNTSDKSSVVNAINEVLASPIDNDLLHALKGYEDEGKLLSDPELFNDVYNYAHSTFDLSKFTAVGTPVLSSSGIASGFSAENYYKSVSVIDCTKPFSLIVNEKKGSANRFNGFELGRETAVEYPLLFVQATETTKITLGLYLGGTLSTTEYDFAHSNYTDVNYVAYWDGTNYGLKIYNAITHELLLNEVVASSTALSRSSESNGVIVYGYNWNNAVGIQSTDLKQTSARQNGLPLFIANETGTDVISNNYTVVGSPTITDGVISNLSTSNYIYKNLSINAQSSNNIIIDAVVNLTTITNNNEKVIFTIRNANNSAIFAAFGTGYYNGQAWWGRYSTGADSQSGGFVMTGSPIVTGKSCVRIIIASNKISYYVGSSFDNLTLARAFTNFYMSGISRVQIGSNTETGVSVDLNEFKIWVDGNLVYTPALSIPYTLAANGLKIVDVAYIDRVKSVYELYNNALYFGIDTVNQKAMLPLGDLYSLMQTAADGQWFNAGSSNISVTTVTAVGTYTVDLSSILPADGHTYECVFRYNIERRDNSAIDTGYKVTSSSGKVWLWEHVEGDPQLSTNSVRKSGQFVAIVDTSRSLTLEINETALNSSGLDLIMYRRCGGNY